MQDGQNANVMEKVGALAVGAVIGSLITYFSQERNRDTVTQTTKELVSKGSDQMEDLMGRLNELTARQRTKLIEKLESMK